AARGAQGLSAALLQPAVLALIGTTFPAGPSRSRALAVWGSVGALGLAAGVLLGGLLTTVSWRLVFVVNARRSRCCARSARRSGTALFANAPQSAACHCSRPYSARAAFSRWCLVSRWPRNLAGARPPSTTAPSIHPCSSSAPAMCRPSTVRPAPGLVRRAGGRSPCGLRSGVAAVVLRPRP